MSEVRRRAPRGQGGALRGEVLQAAMDLLRETGHEESVSVRAVAQRVGVSAPAIYLHFKDKAALMEAVCGEVFEALHVALEQATADTTDPLEALRRQGVAYVQFALANPEHYRIVMMGAPSAHEPAEEVASGAFALLLTSVNACIEEGVLEGDALTVCLQLWASAHGLAALLIAKPLFPWPPLPPLIDATIRAAGIGLAAASRLPDGTDSHDVTKRLALLRAPARRAASGRSPLSE